MSELLIWWSLCRCSRRPPTLLWATGQFSKGSPPWSSLLSMPNKVLLKSCSLTSAVGLKAPEDRACEPQKPGAPSEWCPETQGMPILSSQHSVACRMSTGLGVYEN